LKPHKIRYWLHSPEKSENPETFAAKVNEICSLYLASTDLMEENTCVVSTDEMTGVQALEHKYPDKLPLPGQTAKMEFEYIRHGTTSLIGFFEVATGKIFPPYLNETRGESDFCEAVRQVVETAPEKDWIFVCDGLNTHKSETLVKYVAEACGIDAGLGHKGKSGILKSLRSREEFLHDPSHRIRFVYTPRHCSWMNQIEIWFGIINRKLLRRQSYTSIEEMKESIRRFIEQYNLTAHAFRWTYAGIPLTV
jgi:transposase